MLVSATRCSRDKTHANDQAADTSCAGHCSRLGHLPCGSPNVQVRSRRPGRTCAAFRSNVDVGFLLHSSLDLIALRGCAVTPSGILECSVRLRRWGAWDAGEEWRSLTDFLLRDGLRIALCHLLILA